MSSVEKSGPRWLLPAAFVFGLAILLVVPESWLFVPSPGAASAKVEGERYACPMTCVILDERPPDDQCPVCGMKLGVVSVEAALDDHERAMVGLEAERLGLLRLAVEMRLAGEVDYDERLLSVISLRSQGWLEKVHRKVAWEEVKEGDPLFDLYSPDVYTAWRDFVVARKGGAEEVVSARRALVNLGLDTRALAAVEKSKAADRLVTWHAPRDGVIVRSRAIEGAAMRPGEEVYAVADLRRVWLQLELFESELELLRVGVAVQGKLAGEAFEGRVSFIDPVVDRRSRTARVRLEVENRRRPDGSWALLPGQRFYGSASVALGPDGQPRRDGGESEPVLALPRSSVIDTGRRKVIYVLYTEVEDADGTTKRSYRLDPKRLPGVIGYELVEVELGPLARRSDAETVEDYYPLLRVVPPPSHRAQGQDGEHQAHALMKLEAGHVIATKGSLLLDSQAQLAGRASAFHPEGRSGR